MVQLQLSAWNIKQNRARQLAVLFLLITSHSWSSRRNRRSERERNRERQICGHAKSSAEQRKHPRLSQTFYTNCSCITFAVMKSCFECRDSSFKPTIVCRCYWCCPGKQCSWEQLSWLIQTCLNFLSLFSETFLWLFYFFKLFHFFAKPYQFLKITII